MMAGKTVHMAIIDTHVQRIRMCAGTIISKLLDYCVYTLIGNSP